MESKGLRRKPVGVSVRVAREDEEGFVLHVHADNDYQQPLEIAECFICRLSPLGLGKYLELPLRDDNLVPRALMPPPDGTLITVPAISRRSWNVDVSRDYIQTTMAQEWADCDVRTLDPEEAANKRPEREAKHRARRQTMTLFAVVVLAHRARELKSQQLRLPPFRPTEELQRWWREWLRPRLASLTRRA